MTSPPRRPRPARRARSRPPGGLALRVVCAALLAALLVASPSAHAQPASTDATLQAPADFLGYALGERFTPHHRVVDYVRHVARTSPTVTVQQYGTSVEGRPLLLATVTSPGNHARIDAIRQANLRRTGLDDGTPDASAAPDDPALVWLSYNVHGNESVSSEAAMQTLHALADPSNARTQPWLENTVVLLDPCLNPDGRERYVQWYTRTVGATFNARPEAREHHEPWPGGRTNHYYFDLNRDWAWGVQHETQQRLPVYHDWMPHVHVDFHEQGVDEPYYFAPAADPFHETITDWQRAFQFTIGRNHARYFDRNGWLYFTREVFDLFYPGYGDTWPLFNGAIGMTYEQGGSGRAGLGIVTAEGDTLTLADRIAHHHTTGLSTVEVTAQNRSRVVENFAAYYRSAESDPPGTYDTYVVQRDAEGDRLRALIEHLDRQHIRYGFADRERSVRGRDYRSGRTRDVRVGPGDLIVPAAQPKGRLVKVLFEPETTIIDSLTYDITAWALPYAYGLDAAALEETLPPDATAPPTRPSGVTGSAASPYAYVVRWSSRADVAFAADLLAAGVDLRVAEKPFTLGGRDYPAGTLLVTRAGNETVPDFDRLVRSRAEAHGQPLHAVDTGFTDAGPDVGSSNVRFVDAPHVALLAGDPLSAYGVGQAWHYFDRQIEYPATLLPADRFSADALDDVDVLVLPSGGLGEWLTPKRTEALAEWVRDGGRLIALGEANDALAGRAPFALTRDDRDDRDDDAEADDTAIADDAAANNAVADDDVDTGYDAPAAPGTASKKRYADRVRASLTRATPGSIHRARLDASHPLGFGLNPTYFTLKRSDAAYAPLDDGWNVATLPTGTPVSGFMGHEAQDDVAGSLVSGVQELGDGRVVYLVDDPLFRGFWYAGHLLFGNAVFLTGE